MTLVWALMIEKTRELLHQTDQPNTVDVWLMSDWPYHMLADGKTKDHMVLAIGTVRDRAPMHRTGKGATWPYTVSEVDFTLDHTEDPFPVEKGEQDKIEGIINTLGQGADKLTGLASRTSKKARALALIEATECIYKAIDNLRDARDNVGPSTIIYLKED